MRASRYALAFAAVALAVVAAVAYLDGSVFGRFFCRHFKDTWVERAWVENGIAGECYRID
ncbi:hypothetical protein J5226_14355 [Lysobacter sp. K5869]|uniref:hypothetical protein n=1 Tax=Lysobacter sp. K5869 TaxID=2820808 RepID=UPI001C06224F|nr:hypothetical protein [Lysobacter sp. K5869]QWP74844.1 hypothetical protein J5226_14355 [Lysobacter sp. K5869]